MQYKVFGFILAIMLASAWGINFLTHRDSLTYLESSFLDETHSGITIAIFAGLDEGVYAHLEEGKVTYRYIDGGSSDNRLMEAVDYGTYTFSAGKLTLYQNGGDESLVLEIAEPGKELLGRGIRYQFLLDAPVLAFAPAELPER